MLAPRTGWTRAGLRPRVELGGYSRSTTLPERGIAGAIAIAGVGGRTAGGIRYGSSERGDAEALDAWFGEHDLREAVPR